MAKRIAAGLKWVIQWLWWYYFYIALGILFIVWFPVFRFLIAKPSRYPKAYWLRHKLSWFFLTFHGIRIKKEGKANFSSQAPFIICSNHLSDIDILVLLAAFPNSYAFLGKYELGKYPLFGQFFKTLDVAVDRQDPRKASASYKKALKRLEGGQPIVIFPEGGIMDSSPVLKPFKSGAFIMATKTATPIQPLTIVGSNRVIHPFKASGRPGLIIIRIHEPIAAENKDADQLKEEVFQEVKSGLG